LPKDTRAIFSVIFGSFTTDPIRLTGAFRASIPGTEVEVVPIVPDRKYRIRISLPRDLPQGVIHADLFPDNVFFLGDKLSGLIDFYFACCDALAYDLAVTLNAWCFESDASFNLTKGRALIAGYQSKRALLPAERAAMPLLCRGAALRFLLTRLYDWLHPDPAALVRPKDPREFARRLRFHRTIKSAEAYGL